MTDSGKRIIEAAKEAVAIARGEKEPARVHMRLPIKNYAGHNQDFQDGYRRGLRYAATWLSHRAKSMTDPHAEQVLNSAATNLGWAIDDIERVVRPNIDRTKP